MTLLVVLTVIEVLIVITVLATYLVAIHRGLASVSATLAKITFGIRAVETQTSSIGPSVTRLNEELEAIAAALGPLVEKAERLASRRL